jgi:hypothetical protein
MATHLMAVVEDEPQEPLIMPTEIVLRDSA